jgi:hypothetical protein
MFKHGLHTKGRAEERLSFGSCFSANISLASFRRAISSRHALQAAAHAQGVRESALCLRRARKRMCCQLHAYHCLFIGGGSPNRAS